MRIHYHTLPIPMNKNNGMDRKLSLENNHIQHNLGPHKYTAALEDHRQAIIREWTREMGGYILWIIAAMGVFALGCLVWCILSAFIQVHRENKARMRLASIQVIVGGGILRVSCDGRKDFVREQARKKVRFEEVVLDGEAAVEKGGKISREGDRDEDISAERLLSEVEERVDIL